MNSPLITPIEVVELAFSGDQRISAQLIRSSHIRYAQEHYLRPVLRGLYNYLSEPRYDTLLSEIKPALAHFVRALLIDELAVVVTPQGVLLQRTDYAEAASLSESRHARRATMRIAQSLLRVVVEQIEEEPDAYPEYEIVEAKRERCSLTGGILLPAK